MHVVVTGGTGFIGSHLVDRLLSDTSASVLAVDNLRRGSLANIAQHARCSRLQFLPGDIRDQAFLLEALRGADVVYHLAAQSNVMGAVSDPRYSFETNVCGTFNVLEAAMRCNVRRVVFASSREVYGDARWLPVAEDQPLAAKNTYGASKVAAEAYCRTYANVFNLESVILRFANVYGPRDSDRVIPKWMDQAQNGESLEIHGGRQVIDFIYVGFAVEALLRASTANLVGTPVNIGSGVGTPIGELASRILDVTGSRSRMLVTPERGAEVRRFVADISRMRELLHLNPPQDPLEYLPLLVGREPAEIA